MGSPKARLGRHPWRVNEQKVRARPWKLLPIPFSAVSKMQSGRSILHVLVFISRVVSFNTG